MTKDRTLLGIVTVKDLLLAEDDDTLIKDIMLTNLISVTTHTDQEQVAQMQDVVLGEVELPAENIRIVEVK